MNKFLPFLNTPRAAVFLLFLATALLAFSSACAPSQSGGEQGSPASSTALPELTEEIIHERINDARVRDVQEENGNGKPIFWNFDHDEPKEITVVDKQMDGPRATIVLDIITSSSPRAENQRRLAGQIRTEWQLQTGWVLRRWEIVRTENISMKYKDLPKPPPQNTNQNSNR